MTTALSPAAFARATGLRPYAIRNAILSGTLPLWHVAGRPRVGAASSCEPSKYAREVAPSRKPMKRTIPRRNAAGSFEIRRRDQGTATTPPRDRTLALD
jgi:hypothetical protein